MIKLQVFHLVPVCYLNIRMVYIVSVFSNDVFVLLKTTCAAYIMSVK